MVFYCQLDPQEQSFIKYLLIFKTFSLTKLSSTEVATILSWPQWFKQSFSYQSNKKYQYSSSGQNTTKWRACFVEYIPYCKQGDLFYISRRWYPYVSTHLGRLGAVNQTSIDSDNGLSSVRRQIINYWRQFGLMLIGPMEFHQNVNKKQQFLYKGMDFKMPSAKW